MFGQTEYNPSWQYSSVSLEEQLYALNKAADAGKVGNNSIIFLFLSLSLYIWQNNIFSRKLEFLVFLDQIHWPQQWNTVWCYEICTYWWKIYPPSKSCIIAGAWAQFCAFESILLYMFLMNGHFYFEELVQFALSKFWFWPGWMLSSREVINSLNDQWHPFLWVSTLISLWNSTCRFWFF